ncbi:MAG: alpha/beta hydrolase [Chromatiaceae bacterium]|nr:alpha/beta hydrolase [Chromatiaceae bacterium]
MRRSNACPGVQATGATRTKPTGGAQLPPEVTRACLDELAAAGTDISKINTEQNARDVRAVMRALGYPVYNVYGISYGTKLGLEVMRTAPEGLRSVVLDSVAPPPVPTYDTIALPYAESFEAIFDQCAANAERPASPEAPGRDFPSTGGGLEGVRRSTVGRAGDRRERRVPPRSGRRVRVRERRLNVGQEISGSGSS